jgi:hypothetical protein
MSGSALGFSGDHPEKAFQDGQEDAISICLSGSDEPGTVTITHSSSSHDEPPQTPPSP